MKLKRIYNPKDPTPDILFEYPMMSDVAQDYWHDIFFVEGIDRGDLVKLWVYSFEGEQTEIYYKRVE